MDKLPEKKQSAYIGSTNWAALQKQHSPDALEYATTKTAEGNIMWRSDRKISDFKHTKPESLKQIAAIKLREKSSPDEKKEAPASSPAKQEAAKNLRTAPKMATIWDPNAKGKSKTTIKVGDKMPTGFKLWTGGTADEAAARAEIEKKKKKAAEDATK